MKLSAFQLKVIAALTMALDHIGAVFFPEILWIRAIGRISFPIFAFLLSESCIYTSDFSRYLKRLAVLALVSEIPYNLCFQNEILSYSSFNIAFTLLLGASTIYIYQNWFPKKPFLSCASITLLILTAQLVNVSYGAFGVILIFAFFLFRERPILSQIAFLLLNLGFSYSPSIMRIQLFGSFAIVPLLLYSGKRGNYSFKYFFYFFYPLHLLVLWGIHVFLV